MNKRDFGKLLAELHDDLRKDIINLKSDMANARRLKASIENFFSISQELIGKMQDEDSGLDAQQQKAVQANEAIEVAKTSANTQLASIEGSLASVRANVKEMEDAYVSFTEINKKLEDEDTGLEALLLSATKFESQVNNAKENADANLLSISNSLASVRANVKEMEDAYVSFTEINKKLEDEDTGLEAIYTAADKVKTDIITVKTSADTIYREIRTFRDNAASYVSEVDGIRQEAALALSKIEDNHKQSDALKEKIDDLFKMSASGAHSNYFVERRNQLFKISVAWLVLFLLFLVATILLAISFILPLANSLKQANMTVGVEVFLLRFSIITPTLFGALYSLKQFSNDRRLYEKYAFKAISTYSAESSIATLARSLEEFSDENKNTKIINLAVDMFTSIYQEPLEPVKERWLISGKSKFLALTAEMNQSVGEIKDDMNKLADYGMKVSSVSQTIDEEDS